MYIDYIYRLKKYLDHRPGGAFSRQRIPQPGCGRKEAVYIDIPIASRNGDRKIMQSIRITSGTPTRIQKRNSFSQLVEHLSK